MGVPSWARVGAKVVCVAGRIFSYGNTRVPDRPVNVGEVVTISEVLPYDPENPLAPFWLGFAERHPLQLFGGHRFRPLITQQDDIEAHFKALLNVPHQVDA